MDSEIYLMADTMAQLNICPRCGERGYEHLSTHSHCINCNYYEVKESHSYQSLALRYDHEFKFLENNEQPKKEIGEDNSSPPKEAA